MILQDIASFIYYISILWLWHWVADLLSKDHQPEQKVLVELSLRILWCQENRWWTRHCGRTFGASWNVGRHRSNASNPHSPRTILTFLRATNETRSTNICSSVIERLPRTLMSDSLYTTLCLTMKSLHRFMVYLITPDQNEKDVELWHALSSR